jgi:hypothetical protein
VDWIHLAEDTDQWRDSMNTIMNTGVPYKQWEILEQLTDWQLLKKYSTP